jgi:hypothetical protein
MRKRRGAAATDGGGGGESGPSDAGGSGREPVGSARDLLSGAVLGGGLMLAVLAALTTARSYLAAPTPAAKTGGEVGQSLGQGAVGGVVIGADGVRVFSPEQLAAGSPGGGGGAEAGDSPLLLAILGDVFDVSAGAQHYGPGASYECFVGRDASKAFVSGQFEGEGLTDDLSAWAGVVQEPLDTPA